MQQSFQPALGNFCLIRCVRGVPARVLEDIAQNNGRRDAAVPALSYVRAKQLILGSQLRNMFRKTGFGHRFGLFLFLRQTDISGQGFVNQIFKTVQADFGEHFLFCFGPDADVAFGKKEGVHIRIISLLSR